MSQQNTPPTPGQLRKQSTEKTLIARIEHMPMSERELEGLLLICDKTMVTPGKSDAVKTAARKSAKLLIEKLVTEGTPQARTQQLRTDPRARNKREKAVLLQMLLRNARSWFVKTTLSEAIEQLND